MWLREQGSDLRFSGNSRASYRWTIPQWGSPEDSNLATILTTGGLPAGQGA